MTSIAFGLLAVVVGACAIVARNAWVRAAGLCLTLVLAAVLWQVSLGNPRTLLFAAPSGTVVGYHLNEPNAIYLWLLAPGARMPIAFALPWSEREAAQLQQAADDARKGRTSLQAGNGVGGVRGQSHGYGQSETQFYADTRHQSLPLKLAPER